MNAQKLSNNFTAQALVVVPSRGKSRIIARVDGVLCIFDDKHAQPEIGKPVDVMITGIAYNKDDSGTMQFDNVRFLFLRPVDDSLALIEHGGFSCYGNTGRTLAYTEYDGKMIAVTPGRTGVYVADQSDEKVEPLKRGFVFVDKQRLASAGASGAVRAEGLINIDDMQFRANCNLHHA
jgi:hypothetical protein